MREKNKHVTVPTAGFFLITRLYKQQTPKFSTVYNDSLTRMPQRTSAGEQVAHGYAAFIAEVSVQILRVRQLNDLYFSTKQ